MTNNTLPMPGPDQAFEQYRQLVENNDVAMPMLLFGGSKDMGLAALEVDADTGLQPVLRSALPHLAAELGTPRWVLLSIEAFIKIGVTELSEMRIGGLSAAHAAGDTSIRDCVQIMGVSAGGEVWSYSRIFTRTEAGVVWDDPDLSYEMPGGGVIDILLEAVR